MSEFRDGLDESTRVSLRLLLAVGAPVLGATLWIQSSLTDIKYRLAGIETRQEILREDLEQVTHDRWRRADMEAWVRLMRVQNPDLQVPEID